MDRVTTTNNATLASNDLKINIYLNGVIYNQNADQLIQGFSSYGVDFVNQLEGSYVIFLLLGPQFYIITDKVNSKKAFYTRLDGKWHLSNDIDFLPTDKCSLSLEGIACYLANGCMLNDLTLFQEIRSARRASVHGFKDGELYSYCYWEFKFENPDYSIDQYQYYEEELKSLLIESVEKRYAASSTPAFSLSAGHDSRSILGILHENIKAADISCFSYTFEEPPGMYTDATLSKQLASRCGYPHQTIRSYDGDLIALLKNNARGGKCLSNFCDELDAWHNRAASAMFSDVFVGDQCFGVVNIKPGSKLEILATVPIQDAASIYWLEHFISKKIYRQILWCIDKLADDIYDSTKAISDPLDKCNFLYLDQRVDHVLMPWRENFTSQVGFVHNPYLDGAVLDFIQSLPFQLRKTQFLYRVTVKNMFPDLFSVGMAASSGYQVDWHTELLNHKKELISSVKTNESKLDAIISKNQVLNAIKQYGSWTLKLKEYAIKTLNYIGRTKFVSKVLQRYLGTRYRPKGSLVGSDRLLIRLLLIWIYLSPPSPDQ